MTDQPFDDLWFTAPDGTRLHALAAGNAASNATPLLCLPGLTRNARDFEPVLECFRPSRRVIALSLRGRGLSAHATDHSTYRPDIEMADAIAAMDALRINRFALLGTSRGGIIGMLMANAAPQRLAGLFLNDVGPELHLPGLLRIADYVGQPVSYPSWQDAARGVSAKSVGFAGLSEAEWGKVVRRMYREDNGHIVHHHDLAIANTFPSRESLVKGELPTFWPLFPALKNLPCAALRGEGSDLLSADCFRRMQEAVPSLVCTEVRNRGHVPLLDEPESVLTLSNWLHAVDTAESKRASVSAGPSI